MRFALRLLRPAANQSGKPGPWQDPVFGYFESHGKMEFKPGEQYDMSVEAKQAVLERYRIKEILKKEYLRREYDPVHFRYKQGVTMDPAVFRWYAADMSQVEHFFWTPRTVFLYVGIVSLFFYVYFRFSGYAKDKSYEACSKGELLWWDRTDGRYFTTGGAKHQPINGYN